MKTLSEKTWVIIGIAVVLLAYLLQWGLQDEQDPYWTKLDALIVKDFQTLDKSIPELQAMYENFQKKDFENDSLAFQLIATPFLPSITFEKFSYFFNLVAQQKILLLSSVSGSGTTTVTNRIAKLIATDPKENILNILCAPEFDLEYHKKYIGTTINGKFQQGELLDFFDRCRANPDNEFVVLIDNFDKINPETFFGPELWERLQNPNYKVIMGKKEIDFPENFHLIAVTQAGASSRVELNNEHFNRLGGQQYFMQPNVEELIIYLRNRKREKIAELVQNPESKILKNEVAQLNDTANIKRFLYFFKKANDFITQKYSKAHTLGQWSNVRKNYHREDQDALTNIFINHVNALRPNTVLKKEAFKPVFHSIRKDGKLKGTNFINTQLLIMEEKGFLTEFVVGLSFLIITGLFSLFFFKRRQEYLKSYFEKIYDLMESFERKELDYDTISMQINSIKKEVDTLVMDNKLKYAEATFFYTFIEDKVRRIEISKNVNENFLALMDTFLEDGVLSKKEYKKLQQFLNNIKSKITKEDYRRFKNEIDKIYQLYRKT